jgi:hypothetical protein
MTLICLDGAYDRSAVMRQAHKTYREMRRLGVDDWPVARRLRFAWVQAKGRRELLAA